MGAESDKLFNRGGTNSVNPNTNPNQLFGGQWGAGGYYQPGTNTGSGPSGSAPGDTPQLPGGTYNPPTQNGYTGAGGGPQTGPYQTPNGPLTPAGPQIGGPNATGNPVSPSGPMTPVSNPPANINIGQLPQNWLQNLFGSLGSGGAPGKF